MCVHTYVLAYARLQAVNGYCYVLVFNSVLAPLLSTHDDDHLRTHFISATREWRSSIVAMDIILRRISCESRLPVSLVEDSFDVTCDGSHRCALRQDTSALISGQCKHDDMVVRCAVPPCLLMDRLYLPSQ